MVIQISLNIKIHNWSLKLYYLTKQQHCVGDAGNHIAFTLVQVSMQLGTRYLQSGNLNYNAVIFITLKL